MKQRRPLNKWVRRFALVVWTGLFLSTIGRVLDGNTVKRVISIIVMVMCVVLFIAYWYMPINDSSNTKDQ